MQIDLANAFKHSMHRDRERHSSKKGKKRRLGDTKASRREEGLTLYQQQSP